MILQKLKSGFLLIAGLGSSDIDRDWVQKYQMKPLLKRPSHVVPVPSSSNEKNSFIERIYKVPVEPRPPSLPFRIRGIEVYEVTFRRMLNRLLKIAIYQAHRPERFSAPFYVLLLPKLCGKTIPYRDIKLTLLVSGVNTVRSKPLQIREAYCFLQIV